MIYLLIREEFRDKIGRGEYTLDLITYLTNLIKEYYNRKVLDVISFDKRFVHVIDFPMELVGLVEIFEIITQNDLYDNSEEGKKKFYETYYTLLESKKILWELKNKNKESE